jgi:hypothetical protein
MHQNGVVTTAGLTAVNTVEANGHEASLGCSVDFGFDAEVAADVAKSNGKSPPIAVPAKANAARLPLSVQVSYEPPEFRTVSPLWDQGNLETATDSPIGGGLM